MRLLFDDHMDLRAARKPRREDVVGVDEVAPGPSGEGAPVGLGYGVRPGAGRRRRSDPHPPRPSQHRRVQEPPPEPRAAAHPPHPPIAAITLLRRDIFTPEEPRPL